MAFADMGTRTGTGADLPKTLAADVLDDIRTTSTVATLGRVVQTDTRDSRIPVLAHDVDAFWVGGDSGLKGVSAPQWTSTSLYAEELAVIVPVPDAILDDADMPIWGEVRPLIARAFARRLDAAALFGHDRPTTWSPSLIELATAADATVESTPDPVADVLTAAELVSEQQRTPNGAAVRSGWEFHAATTRTNAFVGNPVADATGPFPLTLAGMGIATGPVYWDRTAAEAIVADWSQVIVGIRQDLTFSLHRDGIISDSTGKIVTNLMQQDTTAMRCVMRVGVLTRQPVIGANAPACPVAVVTPQP